MKIAVYDSKNKDRLLGHVVYNGRIVGEYVEIAVVGTISSSHTRWGRVRFSVEHRCHSKTSKIDPVTEQIVTYRRKCFITDIPLAELMKLRDFRLPDETVGDAERRRKTSRPSVYKTASQQIMSEYMSHRGFRLGDY